VAETQVEGPIFGQSVVLLLAHGDQGTLGLIINRPTLLPLSEVLPDIAQADKESRKLFVGGPVGIDNLIYLFRSDDALAGASHVTDDVYFSGDRQILQKVIGSRESDRLRIYIGHSGWAPGQLDMEIARGDWQIVRADAGTIFDRYPERIWQKLSHRPPSSIASFVVNRIACYLDYYHGSRSHLSHGKDCPDGRAVEPPELGRIVAVPKVGGLHHRYQRRAA
jgi:putative transcriptional regulator